MKPLPVCPPSPSSLFPFGRVCVFVRELNCTADVHDTCCTRSQRSAATAPRTSMEWSPSRSTTSPTRARWRSFGPRSKGRLDENKRRYTRDGGFGPPFYSYRASVPGANCRITRQSCLLFVCMFCLYFIESWKEGVRFFLTPAGKEGAGEAFFSSVVVTVVFDSPAVCSSIHRMAILLL